LIDLCAVERDAFDAQASCEHAGIAIEIESQTDSRASPRGLRARRRAQIIYGFGGISQRIFDEGAFGGGLQLL
jgi:hypothetical protein